MFSPQVLAGSPTAPVIDTCNNNSQLPWEVINGVWGWTRASSVLLPGKVCFVLTSSSLWREVEARVSSALCSRVFPSITFCRLPPACCWVSLLLRVMCVENGYPEAIYLLGLFATASEGPSSRYCLTKGRQLQNTHPHPAFVFLNEKLGSVAKKIWGFQGWMVVRLLQIFW